MYLVYLSTKKACPKKKKSMPRGERTLKLGKPRPHRAKLTTRQVEESVIRNCRTVRGNVDYLRFEAELQRVDELLRRSGVEELFVERSVERGRAQGTQRGPSAKEQVRYQEQSRRALRCTVLKQILGGG
jgi:hypothetical protein